MSPKLRARGDFLILPVLQLGVKVRPKLPANRQRFELGN